MMLELLLVGVLLVGGYFLLHMTFLKLPRCKSTAKLHGKTTTVTGANTGIGKTTAMDLARRGARVIMACRDRQRAEAAIHCALEQGIEHLSGHYFTQCALLKNMASKARDDATAKKLWELRERFCGPS